MKTICECECHIHNMNILHYMACCTLCYVKYINEDGTIDHKELTDAQNPDKKIKKKRRWKK